MKLKKLPVYYVIIGSVGASYISPRFFAYSYYLVYITIMRGHDTPPLVFLKGVPYCEDAADRSRTVFFFRWYGVRAKWFLCLVRRMAGVAQWAHLIAMRARYLWFIVF